MKPAIETMLKTIRRAVGDCKVDEREALEALCNEAEGWVMRLDELDIIDQDDEENTR